MALSAQRSTRGGQARGLWLVGRRLGVGLGAGLGAAALLLGGGAAAGAAGRASSLSEAQAHLKHVVIIVQENRSFDHYFGTYPGADGIPAGVCVPDPQQGGCQRPYHNPADVNRGGPHGMNAAQADIDGGKMDGFIGTAENAGISPIDVMGYHDRTELPNYWAYADNFVLQDALFESVLSWTLPAHLYLVSAWAARCSDPADALSCVNDPNGAVNPRGTAPLYGWTDLTYLLHQQHVTWGYYFTQGAAPDCDDGVNVCAGSPSIYLPLQWFQTVHANHQLGNLQDISAFYQQASSGTLPTVAWVVPNYALSEHPPMRVADGQAYVTSLIDTLMQGPSWQDTAIFVTWDDWGGFYDHVVPPSVDQNGYGLRVPGLLLSAYARAGYIDHQTLSFDAYLKLIEDLYLGGQRLDPATDGRPDRRPTVRENVAQLGDLLNEFDFSQPARQPLVLWPYGPAAWTRLDNTVRGVGGIQYRGQWSLLNESGASGGSVSASSDPTARATFSFSGSGVNVLMTKGPSLGKAYVMLDGTYVVTLDLYSPTVQEQQLVYTRPNLSPGAHKISVWPTGLKNPASSGTTIELDAFETRNAAQAPAHRR